MKWGLEDDIDFYLYRENNKFFSVFFLTAFFLNNPLRLPFVSDNCDFSLLRIRFGKPTEPDDTEYQILRLDDPELLGQIQVMIDSIV